MRRERKGSSGVYGQIPTNCQGSPSMYHSDENTATLNTLIATLIDSVEGYQKSAEDVDNPEE